MNSKKREPRALAKLTEPQRQMQATILSELVAADGGPLLETTVARNAGLYRRRSAWGITEFRLLVDDLAARGRLRTHRPFRLGGTRTCTRVGER